MLYSSVVGVWYMKIAFNRVWKTIISFFVVLALISYFVLTEKGSDILLMQYISLFIAISYVTFFIISFVFNNNITEMFIKRIAIGFTSVSVLYIFRSVWFDLVEFSPCLDDLYGQIMIVVQLYAGFQILNALLKYSKKVNLIVSAMVEIALVYAIIMILTSTNWMPMMLERCQDNSVNITKSFLVGTDFCLLVYFISWYLLHLKYKSKMEPRYYTDLNCYLISCMVVQIISLIFGYYENLEYLRYLYTVTLMNNFYILRMLVVYSILKPHEKLNSELLEKNNELEKMLKKYHKSERRLGIILEEYKRFADIIPTGIMAFKDGKLEHVNNEILKMLKINNCNEIQGKRKRDFLDSDSYEILKLTNNGTTEIKPKRAKLSYNGTSIDVAIMTAGMYVDKKKYDLSVITDLKLFKELEEKDKLIEIREIENNLKDELLSNISHEFKTPVNVIFSGSQLIEGYLKTNNYEQIYKYNQFILNNCYRLTKLINNFIFTIKYTGQNRMIDPLTCLNIVPIVEQLTLSVIPYARRKGIEVTFHTNNEEIYCNINMELIDRMMLNLLSNAIKFNKKDGMIIVYVSEKNTVLEISVKDNGIGIPRDKIGIIFNRFERINKNLSRDCEGSGLGLFIVMSIVEQLGGKVRVESEVGEGSNFTIVLPKVDIDHVPDYDKIANLADAPLDSKVKMELSDIYYDTVSDENE